MQRHLNFTPHRAMWGRMKKFSHTPDLSTSEKKPPDERSSEGLSLSRGISASGAQRAAHFGIPARGIALLIGVYRHR